MERRDKIEIFVGGAFGIIAIVAAIVEYLSSDFSALAGCLKDVFGTLVIVVLLVVSVIDKIPSRDFKKAFDDAMADVCDTYNPLICKEIITENTSEAKANKLNNSICYKMAANVNVLFGENCNDYPRFLEITTDKTTVVKFLIRKTFFNHANFSERTLNEVGNKFLKNLVKNYSKFGYTITFDTSNNNMIVDMNKIMKTNTDAIELSKLVDSAIMLYIAESKK